MISSNWRFLQNDYQKLYLSKSSEQKLSKENNISGLTTSPFASRNRIIYRKRTQRIVLPENEDCKLIEKETKSKLQETREQAQAEIKRRIDERIKNIELKSKKSNLQLARDQEKKKMQRRIERRASELTSSVHVNQVINDKF